MAGTPLIPTIKDIKLVNLTPHPVCIQTENGEIVIEPSGQVARCKIQRKPVAKLLLDGKAVTLQRTQLGEIDGLPPQSADTIYLVSSLAALAAPDRRDLVIIDEPVKNQHGKTTGARALAFMWN